MDEFINSYECFISGGRDSALACYIASEKAREEGRGFRLVFIDTGVCLETTREYVREYARWLNSELVVVKTPFNFYELSARYGYPLIYHNRWCIEFLKKVPLGMLAWREWREFRSPPIWVMGIRRNESLFRLSNYCSERYVHTLRISYNGVENCLRCFSRMYWCPIIDLSDGVRDELLRKYGIPENPAWITGVSGECLCLAGTTRRTLDKIVMFAKEYEPETLEKMIEGDDLVQKHRRNKEPSYPAPLINVRQTLRNYVNHVVKQKTLIKVV